MRPIASVRFRTRRAVLRRRMERARARLADDPWIMSAAGVRMRVDPDDPRAWRLATTPHGSMDDALARAWRALVAAFGPSTVIDVGANYGEIALSTRYPADARLHLFEPNPAIASCLRTTISSSGIDAVLHEVASSDRAGTATLTVTAATSGWSTLEPNDADGSAVSVATARLSDVLDPSERVLAKIDVEGHEAAVVRGGRELLRSAGTWRILLELRPPTVAETLAELEDPAAFFIRRSDLGLVDAGLDSDRIIEHLDSCRDPAWPYLRDLLVRPRGAVTFEGW